MCESLLSHMCELVSLAFLNFYCLTCASSSPQCRTHYQLMWHLWDYNLQSRAPNWDPRLSHWLQCVQGIESFLKSTHENLGSASPTYQVPYCRCTQISDQLLSNKNANLIILINNNNSSNNNNVTLIQI